MLDLMLHTLSALDDPPERDIRTEPCPIGWVAWDANAYDGAPDGDTTVGYGSIEDEAIRDLLEKYGEFPAEDIRQELARDRYRDYMAGR